MKQITENNKKKEYLREYRGHLRRIQRIEAELVELRAMRSSMTISNDGMPRGSGQSDMSDYAAELDRLERDLINEKNERVKAYKKISGQIKCLNNENEKDVLFYRYITGLEWWEIAEKMNYSERWVLKIHGRALGHFNLPKEFIEVQSNM
ncbi:MAG TPA: hypothetical protein DCZ20_01960 [Lachnospiraceae bacterium]|nr:hypothetical protein [Lachnospiraceae bacterium]